MDAIRYVFVYINSFIYCGCLESNPDVITQYAKKLGLDTSKIQFCDILSTEDWALEMVPKPVHAVLLVYPIKPATDFRNFEQFEKITVSGQQLSPDTYFMKQTVPNGMYLLYFLNDICMNNCTI